MQEVIMNNVNKLKNWQLPATGSKLTMHKITLTASYADLVASTSGKGELVAIGNRGSSAASQDRFLDSVRITCDGGAAVAITGMSDSDGAFYQVTASLPGTTVWMPVNLPFNVSLKVEALRNAGANGTAYAFAIVRWVV
jgi:hypothetical protein